MSSLSILLTAVDGGVYVSKSISGNQKHLILNDRVFILNELDKGSTFKGIAHILCIEPTTISKEVKAH